MKKRLIALRGTSNVGKSTTLLLLYKLLVADPSTKPLDFKLLGRKLDFIATVAIDEYKVGLVNRGDVPANLKKLLQQLVRQRCDVIVCAARTKGKVGMLLASYDPPYELVQIPKKASKNATDALANLGVAHNLAAMVYAAFDA